VSKVLSRDLFDAEFEICAELKFNLNPYFLAFFTKDQSTINSALPLAYLDRALTNLHERKKSEHPKEADSLKLGSIFRWYRTTAGKWILDSYSRPTVAEVHPTLISAACLYMTDKVFMNY
jgi:hypothetical protein